MECEPSGVRECGRKTPEKIPTNQFFSFFSWNFQDYIKKCIIHDALICTALLAQIFKQFNSIWGTYTQKTTQMQPKVHFSSATKTFENL